MPSHWRRGASPSEAGLRAAISLVGFALWLLITSTCALAQERLSIENGRRLAVALVQGGQPTAARAAAKALLTRDPNDLVALLVLARAARDLGLFPEAKAAARRAHEIAPKQSADRFGASLAMAQALASGGQRGLAQFWLRRAVGEAPTDEARAVALRDLSYVRWRNPLSIKLKFNAFPSSNVNGGPTTNVLVIGGLEFVDPTAVPLSGLGFSTGADIALRLIEGENQLTLGAAAGATVYDLSDHALALVPTARNDDYRSSYVSVSLGLDAKRDWGHFGVSAAVGRDWRGGEALADWARLSFSATLKRGTAGSVDLSAEVLNRNRLDLALRSSEELGLGAGWSWSLKSGDTVRLGVGLRKVWSDAATVARHSARLEAQWMKAEPILGMRLSAFGSLEVTAYERPLYLLGEQLDRSSELGVMATIEKLDVLGFAPEVGFVLTRTDSNIATMTSEAAEIRLGIRSLY